MAETIKIYTVDDLKKFRDRVNNGERALNAVLMSDINLADINIGEKDEKGRYVSWVPIGNGSVFNDFLQYNEPNPYMGIFDGKGHTIFGLYIDKKPHKRKALLMMRLDREYEDVVGLFCSNGGTIKNLTVAGYIRNDTAEVSGGICGQNVHNGIIENCKNRCTVINGSYRGGYTGGVVGENCSNGIIRNCINEGKIVGCGDSTSGILGNHEVNIFTEAFDEPYEDDELITGCTNYGEIYITYGMQYVDRLKANNYRYNQIFDSRAGVFKPDNSSNHQKGKVIFPFRNSVTGMYFRYAQSYNGYYDEDEEWLESFRDLLRNDPNPEYVNELGQTYLHLLCGFHLAGRPSDSYLQEMYDEEDPPLHLIKLLAKETKIDFSAKDKNGMTAVDYLKKHDVSPHTQEAIDLIESIIKKQNA